MSDFEFGDIAWADGKAWWRSPECDSTFLPEAWESRDGASPLSDLRRHDDFTWLVLNRKRIDMSAGIPWSTLVEVGRREERAAIVAWLRGKYWPAAEAIERGAHLDGEE
jgi:hypothetical protein